MHIGVRRTWSKLVDGHCGIDSVKNRGPAFAELPCQIAGIIQPGEWENAAKQLDRNVSSSFSDALTP